MQGSASGAGPIGHGYTSLYATPDRETHLRSVQVHLDPKDFAPPAQSLDIGGAQAASRCLFLAFPCQWGKPDFEKRNPAPNPRASVRHRSTQPYRDLRQRRQLGAHGPRRHAAPRGRRACQGPHHGQSQCRRAVSGAHRAGARIAGLACGRDGPAQGWSTAPDGRSAIWRLVCPVPAEWCHASPNGATVRLCALASRTRRWPVNDRPARQGRGLDAAWLVWRTHNRYRWWPATRPLPAPARGGGTPRARLSTRSTPYPGASRRSRRTPPKASRSHSVGWTAQRATCLRCRIPKWLQQRETARDSAGSFRLERDADHPHMPPDRAVPLGPAGG